MEGKTPGGTAVSAAEMRYTLSLAMPAKDMVRLKQLDLLRGGKFAPHRINATYYDTPELALRKRDLALAVRQEGRRLVETLEGLEPAGNANAERPVWQAPLSRATPSLAPLAEVDGVGDLAGRRLTPLFTCRLRRNRIVIEPEGAAIALSFDEGTIRTRDGRTLPISEIELELEQGNPQAVFALATALNAAARMRVEFRSKAARGHALVAQTGESRTPVTERFGEIELGRRMPAEEAFAVILKRCLTHMLANDRAAIAGNEEGVHQMRVALRRMRVVLNQFKSLLPDDQQQWAAGEVKWLAASLGKARNWDVFAALVSRVREAFPADKDLTALSRAVGRERRAAYAAMRRTLSTRRYTEFSLRLMGWIETRSWRRPGALDASIRQTAVVGRLADTVLEKRYKQAKKGARAFGRLGPAGRHRFRIALKKLRYAADSFASIYPRPAVRRYVKRLQALQDDLGLLNDIATSERLVRFLSQQRSQSLMRGGALVRGWCGRTAADIEPGLDKRVRRLRRAKPFWRRPAR
jgi:inorganic triphosphatase YgiF